MVVPKDEAAMVDTQGTIYSAYGGRHTSPALATDYLLARILVGKVRNEKRLDDILTSAWHVRKVEVAESISGKAKGTAAGGAVIPETSCVWTAKALEALARAEVVSWPTRELEWEKIERKTRAYLEIKKKSGRYNMLADLVKAKPRPMYDLLEEKEVHP